MPRAASEAERVADPARLGDIRARRRALLAERNRCAYLLRLVNAELDLLVADTLPSVFEQPVPGVDVPAPDWPELNRLIRRQPECRSERLQQLHEAQRQLCRYAEALHTACQHVTDELIDELTPDPSACL